MYKPEKIYNRLIDGTAVMFFSKLPIKHSPDEDLSNEAIVCNIKGFAIPPVKADFSTTTFMHSSINVPNSKYNPYIGTTLNIAMILDEDMDNYTLLYRWLDVYNSTKYREDSNRPDGKWDAQRAFCPFVDILVFDNNKTPKNIIRFKQVFINGLGGISQNFTSFSEVGFEASFLYNTFEIIKNPKDIEEVIGQYV